MPTVTALDHLVLTVSDIEATLTFYAEVMGMSAEKFQPADGSTRWALKFGNQKINLHAAARPFAPHAAEPLPGSADLCFLSAQSLDLWEDHLTQQHVAIEEGPVARTGATGPLMSLYVRDPDGNLIEISNLV